MDLALIKTFLEVAATGSFASASERLFVTQSAVSLRVHRLEDMLGQQLFVRSHAGAEITTAGREFEHHAKSLMRTWELARQKIAAPAGFHRSVTIGAVASLWPSLGFQFIDALRDAMPDLSIRAELGLPGGLMRAMTEGLTQIALTQAPVFHPGLTVEPFVVDDLVLVAPWASPQMDQLPGAYAYVDWGHEFLAFHNQHLPGLSNPGLILAMGTLSVDFLIERRLAAYLPARVARPHLAAGRLSVVPGAASFAHAAWSVWRDDLDDAVATVARKALASVVADAGLAQEAKIRRH